MSGNVYDPHPLMIAPGRYWRCNHGNTGLDRNFLSIGCDECAVNRMLENYARSITAKDIEKFKQEQWK